MRELSRRVRSDKKTEVKPTLSVEVKDFIYTLSYIRTLPVKDVIEEMLLYGVQERSVVEKLSIYFSRDVRVDNTIYMKNENPTKIKKRSSRRNERVSTRIKKPLHESLSSFAYASDCSLSKFCALMIEVVSKDLPYIHSNIDESELDESRKTEYKRLIRRTL